MQLPLQRKTPVIENLFVGPLRFGARLGVAVLILVAPVAFAQRAGLLDHTIPAYLEFSAPTYTVSESGSAAVITVLRTGEFRHAVTVEYATRDGSAVAGHDYSATTGILKFPAGVGIMTFSVPIFGDSESEGPETIELSLAKPGYNGLITRNAATLTITDAPGKVDSTTPTLSVRPGARGVIVVNWRPGQWKCVLEKTDNPVGGQWKETGGVIENADGTCTVTERTRAGKFFYRLRLR